jgi:predicted NBD/HSP70 family sugar kinase
MEYAAGVDFGGSSAKIGLIGRDASVVARDVVPVDRGADFEGVLDPVARRIKALIASRPSRDRLAVAGIGMPGFIDSMGSILNLPDLEACLVGGGIAEAGDILLEPVRQRPPDYCRPEIARAVEVLPAGLGNDAGILGAAAQALERLEGVRGREGPVG